ncbi:hypothetical protein J2X71_007313 [Rhizobium sp. 1399]|nr:hypothetical protein [Rhizobium sp. 1399]
MAVLSAAVTQKVVQAAAAQGEANGAIRPPAVNPTPQQLASAERLGVDPRWIKPNGEILWPPNDGFSGGAKKFYSCNRDFN